MNRKMQVFLADRAWQNQGMRWGIVFGLACTVISEARADFYLHHWENHRQPPKAVSIRPEFQYYSTSDNFDLLGTREPIATSGGAGGYSRAQMDVLGSFGLGSRVTAFGRVGWALVQVEQGGLTGQNPNSFGFTDQTAGLGIRALQLTRADGREGLSLDLQGQVDFPGYSNTVAAQSLLPFLGDSSTDITGGAFLTLPIHADSGTWSIAGGGGYTHRTAGFSAALPYSVSIGYRPLVEGVSFSADASGMLSLKTDESLAVTPVSPVTSGGSFAVNAVNPTLLTVRGQVGYQFGPRMTLWAGASSALIGTSAPAGLAIIGGLQARWDFGPIRGNPARLAPQDYGRTNQGFVTYAFEAKVVRANDKINVIKIDKGPQEGVAVGQVFDIFSIKANGVIGEAVARAKCQSTGADGSELKVVEYYREVLIEEGFLAKRPLD